MNNHTSTSLLQPAPEKRLGSDFSIAQRWSLLNRPFELNNGFGSAAGPNTFMVTGAPNIVLISVHGVQHYLGKGQDAVKPADLATGGLVRLLAEQAGVSAFLNLRRAAELNPYLGETPADRFVERRVKADSSTFILDIHGAKTNSIFDIAIGTANESPTAGQSFVIDLLIEAFPNFRIAVNPQNYTARKPVSVTSRALRCGARQAIQIEFAREWREPDQNLRNAAELVRRFSSFLSSLSLAS